MSTSPTTKQAFNHLTSLATEISEWAKTERNLDEISDWMKAVAHAARVPKFVGIFGPILGSKWLG